MQPNYSNRFPRLCLPGSPLASVSSEHLSECFPQTLLWKYLSCGCIYYILIWAYWMKWWDITDCSIQYPTGDHQVLLYSHFTSVAGPRSKTNKQKKGASQGWKEITSHEATVLSFHTLGHDDAQGNTGPHARTQSHQTLDRAVILLCLYNRMFPCTEAWTVEHPKPKHVLKLERNTVRLVKPLSYLAAMMPQQIQLVQLVLAWGPVCQ